MLRSALKGQQDQLIRGFGEAQVCTIQTGGERKVISDSPLTVSDAAVSEPVTTPLLWLVGKLRGHLFIKVDTQARALRQRRVAVRESHGAASEKFLPARVMPAADLQDGRIRSRRHDVQ